MVDTEISDEQLRSIVDAALTTFYERRIQRLNGLRLANVLARKNPYLFRAMGIETPDQMVSALLAAHTSSSDETIFGDAFFETIARVVSGGTPSTADGIDVEIDRADEHVAVAVKSGEKWGNSQQRRRLIDNFRKARHVYGTHPTKRFRSLLGQAYGKQHLDPTPDKDHYTRSGQAFWREMSGDAEFYKRLIRAMGDAPTIHRQLYEPAFRDAVARFTPQFRDTFCTPAGQIDWDRLIEFTSKETEQQRRSH